MSPAMCKINPRAIVKLQKEFVKPFASKALLERRNSSQHPLGPLGSKAQISHTSSDNQAAIALPSYLFMEGANGYNALAFVASKKLMLEESLRRSTDVLQVGNLLVEKSHKVSRTFSAPLYEDL